jgi:hypothetical protein
MGRNGLGHLPRPLAWAGVVRPFGAQLKQLSPVRKELVKRPEDWRWLGYSHFYLGKATIAGCLWGGGPTITDAYVSPITMTITVR